MEEIKIYNCSKCNEEKTEKQMFKNSKGLSKYCHSCHYKSLVKDTVNKRRRKYCENNKEKISEIAMKHYNKNYQKYRVLNKKYYEENKEKQQKYAKEHYEKHKEKIKEQYYIRRFNKGHKIPENFIFKHLPNPTVPKT